MMKMMMLFKRRKKPQKNCDRRIWISTFLYTTTLHSHFFFSSIILKNLFFMGSPVRVSFSSDITKISASYVCVMCVFTCTIYFAYSLCLCIWRRKHKCCMHSYLQHLYGPVILVSCNRNVQMWTPLFAACSH